MIIGWISMIKKRILLFNFSFAPMVLATVRAFDKIKMEEVKRREQFGCFTFNIVFHIFYKTIVPLLQTKVIN